MAPGVSSTERRCDRARWQMRTYAAPYPNGHYGTDALCEHCDAGGGTPLRNDHLRGWICEECDSALDEMFEEHAPGTESHTGEKP